MNTIWRTTVYSAVLVGICLSVSAQDAQSVSADLSAAPSKAVTVTIPDASLEAALRKALNIPSGSILDSDLATIVELHAANPAKNGRLNGYHNAGSTVLQVTGFATLTDGQQVKITGDSTAYTLVSHTASALTINPGLAAAVPGGTLITVGGSPAGGIVNLSGMEYCTKLRVLDLTGNSVSDLTALGALPSLTHVFLTDNQVADLTPLAGVSTLQGISLAGNQVANLAPLQSLINLTKLDLWNNQIVDLSALAGLSKLTWLDLRENQIVNTAPLAGLTGLTGLALDNNAIGNAGLANLSGLVNLTRLAVNFTQVSSLAPLQGLTNLHLLAAGGNTATDYSALVNNAGIADGDYVFVGTAIGPPADCTSIAALRRRCVIVDDLDACQPAPDRTTDRDGDGLSDYDEVLHYCDPTNPDSDNDGMPDGWEVTNGLNPVSQLDDNLDADGDGTTNLDEFLGQTDPNNPNDPAWKGFVAPDGSDATGDGSPGAPWKSINHAVAALGALNPPAGAAVTVFVRPGTYNEGLVTLPANYRLWGVDYYRLVGATDFDHTLVTVVGRIVAAYPAMIANVYIVPDATPPVAGADALLTIVSASKRLNTVWDGASVVDLVHFMNASGGGSTGWTCIDIKNSTPDQTVIRRCTFINQATGVRVQGALPNINTSTFKNISGDAVAILPTAVATLHGGLGTANVPGAGFNVFQLSSISGKAVKNQSPLFVDVQNNEWGTQDTATIQGRLSSMVGSPEPTLAANTALAAADTYVVLWNRATQQRVLNASVTVSGYSTPVTQNKLGVYPFTPLPRGTYTFTVTAPGFETFTKTVPVALQSDQTALLVPMCPTGTTCGCQIEGEGEGEGEGEPETPLQIAQNLVENFTGIDTNHDGLLNLVEAQAAIPGLTAEQFAAMDANGDGVLSPDEIEDFIVLTIAQNLLEGFSGLDTDHDGRLSFSEAQAAIPGLTAAQFAAMDANGDGVLSQDEIEAYLGVGCNCACGGGGGIAALVAAIIAFLGTLFFVFFCFSGCGDLGLRG